MNDEVIAKKDLPSHIKLSQHLLDKCLFILEVDLFGRPYYIPITKEVERVIKMKEPFKNGVTLADDTDMFRDVINALYLQMRDTVGSEIHQHLSAQIEEGFSKLFELPLAKEISNRLNEKLPPHEEQQKRIDKLESKISVFEEFTIERIVEQKKRLNALERFTIDHIAEISSKKKAIVEEKKRVDANDENIERGVIG
jgi:hypothetical protein